MKTGVLLINLGSPDGPTSKDVGPYLRQFLMDPYVIDLPNPFRWILVNAIIIPFRKHQSAEAYSKIWMKEGSPLVVINARLQEKLQAELGSYYVVELGMRYGEPSIERALHRLREQNKELEKIVVVPLYPQYAASSFETAIQETMQVADALGLERKIEIVGPFYNESNFIGPVAQIISEEIAEFHPDHLLFSYHGLPMKAVAKSCSVAESCFVSFLGCGGIDIHNQYCYRAQCYATTKSVLSQIDFAEENCSVAFQSRLTKSWIQPFSDQRVVELAKIGMKRLAVVCPSFTADCLETLEEVAIGLRDGFKENGGEELHLIPALNESKYWVKGLSKIVRSGLTI